MIAPSKLTWKPPPDGGKGELQPKRTTQDKPSSIRARKSGVADKMLGVERDRPHPKQALYVTFEVELRQLPLRQRRLVLTVWDALSAIRLHIDRKPLTEALQVMHLALEATDRRELTQEDDDARFRIGKLLTVLRRKRQEAAHREVSKEFGRVGLAGMTVHSREITDDFLIAEWPKITGSSEMNRAREMRRKFNLRIAPESICRRTRRLQNKGRLTKAPRRRRPRQAKN